MITFDKEGETPLDDISGLKLKKITSLKEADNGSYERLMSFIFGE